ncbi:MAG: hypothetical protein ACI8QD_000105, partial [Cyclobacteriaceae bacterium]
TIKANLNISLGFKNHILKHLLTNFTSQTKK